MDRGATQLTRSAQAGRFAADLTVSGVEDALHDFFGTVHLADDPASALEAKVTIDLHRVIIWSGKTEIGSWPHQKIKVSREKDGIHLEADGETLILELEKDEAFLDLLGVGAEGASERSDKRSRRKPTLMPEPPPGAPQGSRSSYVGEQSRSTRFQELRRQAAASYPDDTTLRRSVAAILLAAAAATLLGAVLTWGTGRILDPGSFPIDRTLAAVAGIAALLGLYLGYFDGQRAVGAAIAMAAGVVLLVILVLAARGAHLGYGFLLTVIGAQALVAAGALGVSDYGAKNRSGGDAADEE